MKRTLSLIAVGAFATAVVACGPSKEEMEKREQDKRDSIAAVEQQYEDSLAAAAAAQAASDADTTMADTSAKNNAQ